MEGRLSVIIDTSPILLESHQDFVNNNENYGIVVQKYNGLLHFWKLNSANENMPEKISLFFSNLIAKFIDKFFEIPRADTKGIDSLSTELINRFRKKIKNIQLNDSNIIQYINQEFNNYHSQIQEFQREITESILNQAKSSMRFKDTSSRIILPDLKLEKEEPAFRERILNCKNLNPAFFLKEFVSTFKGFISDYHDGSERLMKGHIEGYMNNEFRNKVQDVYEKTKKILYDFLDEKVKSIKPMKVSVLMYQIPRDEEEQKVNQWVIVYERIFHEEEIQLSQVVKLDRTQALITLSLKAVNKLLIIQSINFRTQVIPELIQGASTLIANGSHIDSLVILCNNDQTAYLACLDSKSIVKRNMLRVYSDSIAAVKSAVFLKSKNEIFLINQDDVFINLSIRSNQITPNTQIVPTKYRLITVSENEQFIVLLSMRECYVFTCNLELIYQCFISPFYADINGDEICMILMSNPREITVRNVKIENRGEVHEPNVSVREHQIDSQFRRTLRLGRELINDMIRRTDL